jgi:hypothetical protein
MNDGERRHSSELLNEFDRVLENFDRELQRVRREVKFYIDRQKGGK